MSEQIEKAKRLILFRSGWAKDAPFADEFDHLCHELLGKSGVYCFWVPGANKGADKILYVGKSDNLGSRIMGSYSDKHRHYEKLEVMVSYIIANQADAGLLELWLIADFSPEYNKKDNPHIKPTLSLTPIPEFSNGILVLRRD